MTAEDEVFLYNNNGYNILGILIATLTGNNNYFDDFVKYQNESILVPAGMNRSTFVFGSDLMPNLAKPYKNATEPDTLLLFNSIPTGGMFSTASDMAQLMKILLSDDGKLVNPGTIKRMMQPHDFDFSTSPGGLEYGFGFMSMVGENGFKVTGHNGAAIHYYTEMSLDPDSGLGVFVATNSMTGLGVSTAMGNAVLQTAVMEKTGTLNLMPPRANPSATPIELTKEQLAQYEGLYAGQIDYFLIEVDETGVMNLVITLVPDIQPFPITPMSDGSFISPAIGRLWFDKVTIDGKEEIIIRAGDLGIHMVGVKLEKEPFIATEELTPWLGTFRARPQAGEVSLASAISFSVDTAGIAFMQTAQIMGVSPIAPLSMEEDEWSHGIENITYNAQGQVQSFQLLGMPFTR